MARPRKTTPTKGVSFLEKDRYTAELTSGQLVFGISILLVFGLTCFLLGILVGRFEPAQMQQVAAAPTEETPASPARTEPATTPERTQMARKPVSVESPEQTPGQQGVREDRPRRATVATPAPEPESTEKAVETGTAASAVDVAKATPEEGPKDLTGPRRVEFPNPDTKPSITTTPAAPKPGDAATTAAPSKPETATAAAPSTPEGDSPRAVIIESPVDTPSVEAPETEPMQVASAPSAPMDAVEPLDTPTPPTQPAPAASASGAFSIQVAAMSKESNAEALQKRFDAELPYGARIERVPSRGLSIVLVGGFESRDAAQSALREFKAKYPNFSDAFVRAEK